MRYGFLGPETTFTHQALLQALAETPEEFAAPEPELVPFSSVATAAADLIAGDIDALMAPIENSVEGGVSGTLDVLAATDSITIVAEQTVQISFVLAARERLALEELTTVSSHPHAQAQVQGWLRAHVPGAHVAAASSTAAAARDLAAASPEEARGRAAVCSPLAARHFGLEILAEGIEDFDGAITRFVLVTREGRIPARTGADKTTIAIQLPHNRSGALLEALEILGSNGVNMSRIESRPIGDFLGRYSFSLDLEGHLEDRRVAAALRSLHRLCPVVQYLGSYPRADGQRPEVREDFADHAYDDAREWLEHLGTMITPTVHAPTPATAAPTAPSTES
ncbi:prephenate dehydratase [Brachybacterium saurashtrense]|uniref:Prephenate dehydratase n=1 Tax=Brachybacterium saurashtrense TaxID=556288 RepID=A0A345YK42_9MICO|nr:prephenate dehydratase [Brachybacterium saurashtrense]AXK44294.1 prephenate dehydratase [Brachybacterium saurashtrense]RRR21330.1 prephenate dehydratase [Brachybacterium saurashtrense]RRR22905.1 prephenate dehydratase [Brachybacterium saurashtrense]